MMDWINAAILGAAVLGAVNVIDSHLLSKRMPGLRAFLIPVAVVHLAYGLLLFFLFPLPAETGPWPILLAVVSGLLRTLAVIIMLDGLQRQEVSQVIPVVYSYPIFVAVMAVPLLGESLSGLDWLAVVIVVLGAVLVSLKRSPLGAIAWRGRVLLLFGASVLFALADVASKYALGFMSSWNMFWITTFCMVTVFLSISLRPGTVRQLLTMERRNSALGLLVFNETLAPLGIALMYWALERGPVSLVSTIFGSRPLFVLLFAIILSRVWPSFLEWSSGRWMMVLRIAATVMIVSGITIIHLT